MDVTPDTLREIAEYLRNATRLFPSPRAKKAYEWLTIKAGEIDEHAGVWEVDRTKIGLLREMYRIQTGFGVQEIDAIILDQISGEENAISD